MVLLALLSWLPAEDIIRTGINGRIEHFIAYMGTTLFVGAAYALRLGSLRIMAMLIGYAGILELGQNFSPGRHSTVLICCKLVRGRCWRHRFSARLRAVA